MISYTQNNIPPKRLLPVVMTAMAIGLNTIALTVEASPWISVAVLLLVITLVITSFMETVTFTVTEETIIEDARPKFAWSFLARRSRKAYNWSKVISYKYDTDLTRSLQARSYLKIHFGAGKTDTIKIPEPNDTNDQTNYKVFIASLLEILAADNTGTVKEIVQKNDAHNIAHDDGAAPHENAAKPIPVSAPYIKPLHIIREKSFYEKPIAKVITIFFAGLTLWLLYLMAQGYGSWTNYWKMIFVLLPGTGYMFYRSFYAKKKDKF